MAQKPYLSSPDLPPDRVPEFVEWGRYLCVTFGASGALNALRYYERLGWISPSVRDRMVRHFLGFSTDELHNKKYNDPETLSGPLEPLSGTAFGAHARSLRYIASLAGHDLEGSRLEIRMARQELDIGNPGVNSSMSSVAILEDS